MANEIKKVNGWAYKDAFFDNYSDAALQKAHDDLVSMLTASGRFTTDEATNVAGTLTANAERYAAVLNSLSWQPSEAAQ